MARGDGSGRLERAEERIHVESGELGQQRGRRDAGQVGAHRIIERNTADPTQRIEQRAVDERRSVARDQGIQVALRAGLDLGSVMGGAMAEGAAPRRIVEVGVARDPEREAQLLVVVLVGKREVFVEPLGREQFGGHAPPAAPVLELDAHARECLRRLGQRDHAEAKRHTQLDVAFVQCDLRHAQQRGAHSIPSSL